MTEHDKYAKGATKPGGFAAAGFYGSGKAAAEDGQAAAAGLEFLSSRPPWKCNICNVSCTSRETLLGHATGAKHKRRVSSCTILHLLQAALCVELHTGSAAQQATGRGDCAEMFAGKCPSATELTAVYSHVCRV